MNSLVTQSSKRRLIVMVSDSILDNLYLAYQVHDLAAHEGREVLYFTLADNAEKWLESARDLATLKAVTAGNHLAVESLFVNAREWEGRLREIVRPGDKIACIAGHRVKTSFFQTGDLAEIVRASLDLPVVSIPGILLPTQNRTARWVQTLTVYAGFLAIVVSFSWLEIELRHAMHGVAGTLLLLILFGLEGGLFWVWNSITYR